MATSSPPFSADALNRFRMSHSDRDIRALTKRLNRLPYLEESSESDLAQLEIDKWRFGIERQLAAVRSLERQAQSYTSRAEFTRQRNAELKATLEEEKKALAAGLAERAERMKCDEVAKRIMARGKSRAELEEQISTLEASIAEHKKNYEAVLAVAEARVETFNKITALVEECRGLKLPTWTGGDEEEVKEKEEKEKEKEKEVAKPVLSATSLPFQPAAPSTSRAGSSSPHPNLPQRPHGRQPARPMPPARAQTPRYPSARLPARPTSGLRYQRGGLEDGEVGEEEVRGSKRKVDERDARDRNTRRK